MVKRLLVPMLVLWATPAWGACPEDDYEPATCVLGESGTCRQACDLSVAKIQATIDAAAENADGIYLPGGTATIGTANINLNKSGVTLIGQGIGQTTLTFEGGYYLDVPPGTSDWTIRRISFVQNGDTSSRICINVGLYRGNPGTSGWSVAECDFRNTLSYTSGNAHYIYVQEGDTRCKAVIAKNVFYGGGVGMNGAGGTSAWSSDTAFGSDDFLFVEGNLFSSQQSAAYLAHSRGIYAGHGAKVVARWNSFLSDAEGEGFSQTNPIDGHGYCHGTNCRGTRAYEIYNNVFQAGADGRSSRALFLRAGTGVVYQNLVDMSLPGSYWSGVGAFQLGEYRLNSSAVGQGRDSCGNGDGTSTCGTPGGDAPLCLATFYALPVSSVAGFVEGDVVTGVTSGATATVWGIGATRLYFQSAPSGTFDASGEALTVGGVSHPASTAGVSTLHGEGDVDGKACCDTVGRGRNQASEPYYFWSNRDDASDHVAPVLSTMVAGYIVLGEDVIDNGTTPMAGYTAHPCPHPTMGYLGSCRADVEGWLGYDVAAGGGGAGTGGQGAGSVGGSMGGTGGAGATGGAAGDGTMDDEDGCGCRLRGSRRADGACWALAVLLALGLAGLRRSS